MKRIVISLLISLSIVYGCGGYCNEYVIENKTDKNLEIISFRDSTIIDYNIAYRKVLANNYFVESRLCSSDGGHFLGYTDDSIQVKSKGILLKTYYPDDKVKSIFRTEDNSSWRLVENRSSYEKRVFEITDEDLK